MNKRDWFDIWAALVLISGVTWHVWSFVEVWL